MNCYDPDSLYIIFTQVIRFHYHRTHKLLERVGAYPGQPPLFFALAKNEGMSQKELGEKLHIKAATITVMLNRMEKAGLLERRPDPSDQRIMRVYFTDQGRKVHAEVIESLKEIEAECFDNFTDEEKILLRRFFLQMRDNLIEASEKKN